MTAVVYLRSGKDGIIKEAVLGIATAVRRGDFPRVDMSPSTTQDLEFVDRTDKTVGVFKFDDVIGYYLFD